MCGRYSLAIPDGAQLQARFPVGEYLAAAGGEAVPLASVLEPRYNVAPGTDVVAVGTDREGTPRGQLLRWGFVPGWADDPRVGFTMINARAEGLTERRAYKHAFEHGRCLIPADGFFEWQQRPEGTRGPSQPFHVTRADGGLFAFAGLWTVWHRGQPDELRSCTIITTAANDRISSIHPRMPVILADPEQEQGWLDPSASAASLQQLLRGLDAALTAARPVGFAVNDVRCDGPECLADPAPAAAAPPPPQGTLFA